jgi:C1A family cysteine protease
MAESEAPEFAQGWINDPQEVEGVVALQPFKTFSDTEAGQFMAASALPENVYLWDAARKVIGKLLPPRSQGKVGSCVAFGCIRAIEYTQLAEIAAGENEEFRDLCTEINYGGGRVEVGGNRLGRGDGSIGAWSAEFAKRWGSLDRAVYSKYDFRVYNEAKCREYGAKGVPDDLEPEVKKYPISTITLVKTTEEAKKALAAGYGISVASGMGFRYTRNANGICAAAGSWAHQMCICGYAKIDGNTYFRIDNSWGADAHTGPTGPGNPGPEGFYAAESTAAKMLAEGDSFAYAGQKGFVPRNIIDWFV